MHKRIHTYIINISICWSLHGSVVNVLDNDILICEFKIQSRYDVQFLSNTIVKGLNRPIPQQ